MAKNRSTLAVSGLWQTDAPKGTCSEPPFPFPGVDNPCTRELYSCSMISPKKIEKKYQDGIATGKYPKENEVSDPEQGQPNKLHLA
jgi:hypothetical protein